MSSSMVPFMLSLVLLFPATSAGQRGPHSAPKLFSFRTYHVGLHFHTSIAVPGVVSACEPKAKVKMNLVVFREMFV